MLFDRSAILARKGKLRYEDVPMPEWVDDGTLPDQTPSVRIRGLSAIARDQFEATYLVRLNPDGKPDEGFVPTNIRAPLVALCAIDADGKPLFTEEDVADLQQLDGAAIDKLYRVAARLSGLAKNAVESAKND